MYSKKALSKENMLQFINIIGRIDSFFNNRIQQDAHEAFIKLFEMFDTGINAILPNSRFYDSYYQGLYKVVKTCINCNNRDICFEPFHDIKVQPCNDTKSALKKALVTIQNEMPSSYFCIYCDSISNHNTSCTVFDHPRILLVFLDRHTFSSSHRRARRNNGKITVDTRIDFSGTTYELRGIINHLGASVTSGHYTAFVYRNNAWYECDDARIQKLETLPNPSSNAYLLFYTRTYMASL